jgi:hypothetical protein
MRMSKAREFIEIEECKAGEFIEQCKVGEFIEQCKVGE